MKGLLDRLQKNIPTLDKLAEEAKEIKPKIKAG